MVIYIKWPKVILFALMALFLVFTALCLHHAYSESSSRAVMQTSSFDEQSEEDKLLVYVFLDAIREQSNLFYEPYYTQLPQVTYDGTYKKSVEESGVNSKITFVSLPYIGPHDTIGEDEITFEVNRSGKIVSADLKHLVSYSLPDNLLSIQKELPPIA
ncbi:MAG: hypothetical protein GXW99_02350 [Clostridiales bacterium]|nr:hypothetical protein [Clostridiales bacterium]